MILLRGEIRILEQQLVELPQYRSGTVEYLNGFGIQYDTGIA